MDPHHFDGLTKALGQARTRRTALGGLLAGLLLPLSTEAKRKTSRGKDAKQRKRKGHQPGKHQTRKQRRKSAERQAQAEAVCYSGTSCTAKPGANLTRCDFTGSAAMQGATCAGCNLSKTGFRNADLSGADLARTNLDKACLVGANLRGALLAGANSSGAIYCGTIMPDGSVNDRDCAKGTACCPTCDAGRPCGSGQVCCANSCVAGNCCGNGDCTDPATPICTNNRCAPCTSNAQCGTGKRCCGGQCTSGVCCAANDCPDRSCQTKACTGNQCVYTTASNGTTCGSNLTCQNGACVCQPVTCQRLGKSCGAWADGCGGTITCGPCAPGNFCDNGACKPGCQTTADCASGSVCSSGSCQVCNVTCTGSASACGTALQTALSGPAPTLYVCPGRYQGGFSITRTVTVVGAGDGNDPVRHTILDGNKTQRVIAIPPSAGTITLQHLRVAGGAVSDNLGAGIFNDHSSLEMRSCTLVDNHAASSSSESFGGAISSFGSLTLTDCHLTGNSAGSLGGGIHVGPGTSNVTLGGTTIVEKNEAASGGGLYVTGLLTINETSRVQNNTADTGKGGGIFLNVGIVTLQGASPSPIVVNNCRENCAGQAIAGCQSGGACLTS